MKTEFDFGYELEIYEKGKVKMKTQIKELDKQFYELDNMCNSCSNPLPIFDNLTITIGSSKYQSPLCKTCLDERGIRYDN